MVVDEEKKGGSDAQTAPSSTCPDTDTNGSSQNKDSDAHHTTDSSTTAIDAIALQDKFGDAGGDCEESDDMASVAHAIYFSQAFQAFGDRIWAFTIPMAFIEIFPTTLLPVALYGFAGFFAQLILLPSAGRHVCMYVGMCAGMGIMLTCLCMKAKVYMYGIYTRNDTAVTINISICICTCVYVTHTHTHTHMHTFTHTHTGGYLDRTDRMEAVRTSLFIQNASVIASMVMLYLVYVVAEDGGYSEPRDWTFEVAATTPTCICLHVSAYVHASVSTCL